MKMSLDDICKKFDVKPATAVNKFARLMAKEQDLESFFVADKSPKFPKIQKNGKVTISKSWCEANWFKPGAKIVIDEVEVYRIVINAR
jgi:hypothetical protein